MDSARLEEIKKMTTLQKIREILENENIPFLMKNIKSWRDTQEFLRTITEDQFNQIYKLTVLVDEIQLNSTLTNLTEYLELLNIEFKKANVRTWAKAKQFLGTVDNEVLLTLLRHLKITIPLNNGLTLNKLKRAAKTLQLGYTKTNFSTWDKAKKWLSELNKVEHENVAKEAFSESIIREFEDLSDLQDFFHANSHPDNLQSYEDNKQYLKALDVSELGWLNDEVETFFEEDEDFEEEKWEDKDNDEVNIYLIDINCPETVPMGFNSFDINLILENKGENDHTVQPWLYMPWKSPSIEKRPKFLIKRGEEYIEDILIPTPPDDGHFYYEFKLLNDKGEVIRNKRVKLEVDVKLSGKDKLLKWGKDFGEFVLKAL